MTTNPPKTNPYTRHIFICTGKYCDPQGQGRRLYQKLAFMLGELSQYSNPCRVKRGETPCLGICHSGPIAVVYPEGVWYHHLDEPLLQRIIDEHLRQDKPVTEHIFHQLGRPGALDEPVS